MYDNLASIITTLVMSFKYVIHSNSQSVGLGLILFASSSLNAKRGKQSHQNKPALGAKFSYILRFLILRDKCLHSQFFSRFFITHVHIYIRVVFTVMRTGVVQVGFWYSQVQLHLIC